MDVVVSDLQRQTWGFRTDNLLIDGSQGAERRQHIIPQVRMTAIFSDTLWFVEGTFVAMIYSRT